MDYVIKIADQQEREEIYKIRHEVYAVELKQHPINEGLRLKDDLDSFNIYLVAKQNNKIVGFISITPPGYKYSMDKYLPRNNSPFIYDGSLYEIRILTVIKKYRNLKITLALMYASVKWIENLGGINVMILGRIGITDIYKKVSFKSTGIKVQSGKVMYHIMYSTTLNIINAIENYKHLLHDIYKSIEWNIGVPFYNIVNCYHGGKFFDAIGNSFRKLELRKKIINADVLDAWFDPCPEVLSTIKKTIGWVSKTSPPMHAEGLIAEISKIRNISDSSILIHSGSSSIMYLAFSVLLNRDSKVLILDPSYGEYLHIFNNVIQCKVDRYYLNRDDGYEPDLDQIKQIIKEHQYQLFVLVNPNNPSGKYIAKNDVITLINGIDKSTLVWVDETYIEYAGNETLETEVENYTNLIVCKSMSKAYALSGLRVAYMCSHPLLIKKINQLMPPWSVSLPAQIAAVKAISNRKYYEKCYRQTHAYRHKLASELIKINGVRVIEGQINSILVFIENLDIRIIYEECKKYGLFIRPFYNVGLNSKDSFLRISVKDKKTNIRIGNILKDVLAKYVPVNQETNVRA